MKNILKFGLIACLATAFVLAGCKKDDDDDNNGGSNTSVSILPKKVSKIVVPEEKGIYTYTFNDEGKVSSRNDGHNEVSYTYDDNKVFQGKSPLYNLENGRITSSYYSGDIEEYFDYSSDGYLISVTADYHEYKYTIENGSLTKSIYGEGQKTDGKWEGEYVETFTYGNKLNNLNVDIFAVVFLDANDYSGASYSNLIGKRQKYLPSKVRNFTVSYEYDGEYLTKVIVDMNDWGTETYEIFY